MSPFASAFFQRLTFGGVMGVLLILCAFSLSGCKEEVVTLTTISGDTMGTRYTVTVASTEGVVPENPLRKEIEASLEMINQQMSTYDPTSELSVFNQSVSTEWFDFSVDTIELIQTARRVSRDTDGAYDVTLGSVIELWGFGRTVAGDSASPSMDSVLEQMNNVGHQLLQISKDGQQVRKLIPNLTVDLSSIAKGFAVDKIGSLLEGKKLNRYVVEIGGEIRTRGLSSNNEPWQIGIESPNPETQASGFVGIAVENAHIATSGDYRNYREIDGQRLSHIIDGRSGYPVNHNLASVTVLHGNTMLADAWATAFMVMGEVEAMKVANEKGLAAAFTVREGGKFINRSTKAFDAYKVK